MLDFSECVIVIVIVIASSVVWAVLLVSFVFGVVILLPSITITVVFWKQNLKIKAYDAII